MFERPPDLNTTVDYLLQTDQGSLAFLVEVLVSETYAWLCWLGLALVDDEAAAREAAVQALVQALEHTYQYRGGRGVQPWLAGFLLAVVATHPRWPAAVDDPAGAADPNTAALVSILEAQDLPGRAVLVLRYLFGWPAAEIARVEGLAGGLAARLLGAERQLEAALADPGAGAVPELERVVGRRLEQRWPAPAISEAELEQVIGLVQTLAARRLARQRRQALVKETLLVGLIILGMAAAFWGFNTFVPPERPPTPGGPPAVVAQGPKPTPLWNENVAYVVQANDTLEKVAGRAGSSVEEIRRINALTETQAIYSGLPLWVPVPEFAPGAPTQAPLEYRAIGSAEPQARLSIDSAPAVISQRMAENSRYWRTLWADLQMVSYALVYNQDEASAYRIQVWLRLPDRSLELYNDLSAVPAFRHIILNGRNYTSAGPYTNSYLAPDWLHPPQVLLQSPLLRQMFFMGELPASDLKVSGLERVAGRDCLIVDYRTQAGPRWPSGEPEPVHLRLWVDTETGVILRRQQFNPSGEPGGERLLSDVIVTEVAYNVDIPAELFDPRRRWEGGFAADWRGRTIPPTYIEPTPTWALPKTP